MSKEQVVKALEEALAILTNGEIFLKEPGHVTKLEQPKTFPQKGDKYWYVNDDGDVADSDWCDNSYVCQGRLAQGNCFRTEQEAIIHAKRNELRARLIAAGGRAYDADKDNWGATYDVEIDGIDLNNYKTQVFSYMPYFDSHVSHLNAFANWTDEEKRIYFLGRAD